MEIKFGCCSIISVSVAIIMAALIIAGRSAGEIIDLILYSFIPAAFLLLAVVSAVIIIIFFMFCICCG